MPRLRQTALVVLLVLAGQMAGAGFASGDPCCPAMAGEGGTGSPCASLAALGCCETLAPAALPDGVAPPTPALPGEAAAPPPVVPANVRATTARFPEASERALEHTILRL